MTQWEGVMTEITVQACLILFVLVGIAGCAAAALWATRCPRPLAPVRRE
jgi:hypothetical protein